MEWMLWLLFIPAIAFLWITSPWWLAYRERKSNPVNKNYVYQQPMLRRWTETRKSESRLEKADWDVDFYALDAKASAKLLLDADIDATTYIPTNVLKFASKQDPVLFRKLMAHNQRVDIRNGVPLAIVRDYNDY